MGGVYMLKKFILDDIKNHTVKFTVSGDQTIYRKDIQTICRKAGVEEERVISSSRETQE